MTREPFFCDLRLVDFAAEDGAVDTLVLGEGGGGGDTQGY